jgi:hypothetical protein
LRDSLSKALVVIVATVVTIELLQHISNTKIDQSFRLGKGSTTCRASAFIGPSLLRGFSRVRGTFAWSTFGST